LSHEVRHTSQARVAVSDGKSHATELLPFLRQIGSRHGNGIENRNGQAQRRVAVIGSGIAGLSAAWALTQHAQVTLFEANDYFGGHTNTVDVELEGQRFGVDTGFLVFNERTYPLLIQMFEQLDVTVAASDMSFSVQSPGQGLEWSGSNLNSVFAQRRNLLRPAFWRMLADLRRFNSLCTALAASGQEAALQQPIGDFLDQQRFSRAFRDWYLLPMVACIWSCPTAQMLSFPISTLIRFCHNHGLLQVTDRPQWFTVRGGARHYVHKLLAQLTDARLSTPVSGVTRLAGGGVMVHTRKGSERFDEVVMAGHSDQSLRLLEQPSTLERQVLGAIGYHRNRALLHVDKAMLPQRPRAWAAWNYEHGSSSKAGRQGEPEQSAVCLHYLLNRLQPLPCKQPVLVSLNPVREPDERLKLAEFDYAHPVFDAAAVAAQAHIPLLQGQGHVWFCGAWTRYGFHEDGLLSGLKVAKQLTEQWARQERGRASPP
jgi:predicted NAD/FAD-binding protein